MIKTLLIIGGGGFLGSILRYLIAHYFTMYSSHEFPFATLVANLLGCLIIGMVFGTLLQGGQLNQEVILFMTVGFCGSLTTFSTFSYENILMINKGRTIIAFLYTGLSFTTGLGLTWLGLHLSKLWS